MGIEGLHKAFDLYGGWGGHIMHYNAYTCVYIYVYTKDMELACGTRPVIVVLHRFGFAVQRVFRLLKAARLRVRV